MRGPEAVDKGGIVAVSVVFLDGGSMQDVERTARRYEAQPMAADNGIEVVDGVTIPPTGHVRLVEGS